MVRAQDEAFIKRDPVREKRGPGFAEEDEEEDWIGRGTSALFMVNRELSLLAAVHLFTVSFQPEEGGGFGADGAASPCRRFEQPRRHTLPRISYSPIELSSSRRPRLRRQPRVLSRRSHQLLALPHVPPPPSHLLFHRSLHGRDETRSAGLGHRIGRVHAGCFLRGGDAGSSSRLLPCRPLRLVLRHDHPRKVHQPPAALRSSRTSGRLFDQLCVRHRRATPPRRSGDPSGAYCHPHYQNDRLDGARVANQASSTTETLEQLPLR